MNRRNNVLNLLNGKKVPRVPVMPITMMFAADQIGRPYGEYALNYKVMSEAQIVTAERFNLDYVSSISDPARETADFGAKIEYFHDQPPAVDESNALLSDKTVLAKLKPPDPLGGGRMHDRIKAIEVFRKKTGDDFLIEGWVEGPCAEGADLRGINALMLDFFDDPQFISDLFELVIKNAANFAKYQIEAGADIIGIGDAAASLVGPEIYKDLIFPYEKRLIENIHSMNRKVRLHICGNISDSLETIGKLKADIVDLDSMVSVAEARRLMGTEQILLGNINPVAILRNGTPELVYSELEKCFEAAAPNYIVGAGCEVPRDTPPENLKAMSEFARKH